MVVPSYEVRVPALWGAAPRIMPLAPGSTRSCSSSCSSCSDLPVAPVAAPKVRSFQALREAVPRPGTLHTVDLSKVEEEATLAAMTVPAQSSNLKAKKSSVIFSTVKREEQKNPMRTSADMEELQRENDRLMRSLQERTAQEKELERNARMQSIIFQRREQDLRLACESAACRPSVSEAPEVSEVSKGTPGQREQLQIIYIQAGQLSIPRAMHLKLPIRAAKASVGQQSANCEAAVFPEASSSARSSRSSVSQPNLLHGVEAEDGADVISWITPCLAEEECPRSRSHSAGSHSDLSTPSRSAESTSSQAAGSTQRWIISLSKVEVEAVVKEAANHQQPAEEEDCESSCLPEETPALSSELLAEMYQQEAAYDASPPVEETPALSSELLAEMYQQEAAYDASPPVEEEDCESSRLPEETPALSSELLEEMCQQEAAYDASTPVEEAAAASELPAEIPQADRELLPDVDGQASDSDSDEDSGSDTSDSSDSSGSSTSSSSGPTDSEEESESSPENGDSLDKAQNEAGNAEGFAPTNALDAARDTSPSSPIFQEREVEEVPELSATTVWRNKILGRLEAPQRMARQKGLENLTMPRHQVPAPCMSPPHPLPKRTVELSGTDALVSLRLSAKELAKEKLKMLQQHRAEAKGTGVSLPQLGAKLAPESLWEVSQVPQAAHFTKLGKARMSKQAAQSKGNKNNPFKASMTQSQSLPSISAPSQFGITAGVQKKVLQAPIPSERPMDMRT
ncbi:unnamed protein product [Cladocopium goreaui]|uniref:Uncharacterized protein n=1 Tax=Cladocopium goreaui TaxID=2562237 RepID=A0A9P1GR27_9DINO|nr:unnamed protein product [Cladocopium goreaui]